MEIGKLDWSSARGRPADYIQICETLADTYPKGRAHGVQKDAIQNGWDAVKKDRPLRLTFELLKNEWGCFLAMTDSNTTGLTGRVITRPEEYLNELPEEERWARFESFAFTKQDPDAIGARGQGKFIFLAASKQHTMLYETLRDDKVYRLGITKATRVDCPMMHWEGIDAKRMLRSLTGLEPIRKAGTQIIIVDPVDTVIEEIRTGDFTAAIEETWLCLIGKGWAQIVVKALGKETQAQLPFPFPIPDKDTDDVKVWLRENDEITVGGVHYRIKRMQVGRRIDGRVREDLRGVAVIHNGMKICSIPMLWAEPTIRDSVFGYVEFDYKLDRELRKTHNQVPNHYDLQWRRVIPRAIKNYVEDQLQQFGQEKLGIGVDWRQRREQIRTEAEQWALRQLSILTPDFYLMGGLGGTRRPLPPPHPRPTKEIGLTFHDITFPDPRRAPLVRWDERLTGFSVEAFNNKLVAYTCRIGLHVFHGTRQVVRLLNQTGITLTPGQSIAFGPLEIQFLRQMFPSPDVYTLRAVLVNEANGERLDELNRYIYLEKDPPFRAPFDVQMVRGFSPPFEKRQWRMLQTSDDRATLYYNGGHPAYRHHEEVGALRRHLFETFLEGALELVLDQPVPENAEADYRPLDRAKVEGAPSECYLEIIGKLAEVRHNFFKELG